jgi:hypothetical protein
MGGPAGGSLTADQWLVFATVVAPLAVRTLHCSHVALQLTLLQIPQIWQDYLGDDSELVIPHRSQMISASIQKKRAAAAAAARLVSTASAATSQPGGMYESFGSCYIHLLPMIRSQPVGLSGLVR